MERISDSDTQLPIPPPYTSIVFGKNENEFDGNPPPSYSDIGSQSVVYINNYPGPPLTDGQVEVAHNNLSTNNRTILPKKIRIYLIISGIITILCGFISIGIQIPIITSHSITYYYYGFWGGAIIIIIGTSTILLNNSQRTLDDYKLFHSFFWKMIYVAVILAIGIVIVLTDKCDDNGTEDDDSEDSCRGSYKIFNGFLLGSFALAFLQSIINAIVFGFLNHDMQ